MRARAPRAARERLARAGLVLGSRGRGAGGGRTHASWPLPAERVSRGAGFWLPKEMLPILIKKKKKKNAALGKSEIVYHHGLDHQPLLNRDMCKCLSRFKILVLESFPQPSPPSTSHPYSVNSCELNDHKGLRLLKGQLPILPHPLPFCNLS